MSETLTEEEAAWQSIMATLLALSENQRAAVFEEVLYNGIFCVHCGIGSRETPNPRCQCTNDE